MKLTAARYLRDREPLPDALLDWLVEVLEGKRKKPGKRPGPKRFSFRNIWIMSAVNTLIQLGMNPTRTITRGRPRAPTVVPPAMPWVSRLGK